MRLQTGPLGARLCVVLASLFTTTLAHATTFRTQDNLVDLVKQADTIIRGRVMGVTDGIDPRGIPYTEVTIHVAESIKGQVSGTYRFRQFGLLKPRKLDDGRVNLMVTPAAWPTYAKGEEAILFLRKPAAWTGLQTTAGLGQGKFTVSVGGAVNQFNNAGLFKGVEIDAKLIGDTDRRLIATQSGALNALGFTALLKQAVAGQWVEKGEMRHVRQ
jgi:hypothetical protein